MQLPEEILENLCRKCDQFYAEPKVMGKHAYCHGYSRECSALEQYVNTNQKLENLSKLADTLLQSIDETGSMVKKFIKKSDGGK